MCIDTWLSAWFGSGRRTSHIHHAAPARCLFLLVLTGAILGRNLPEAAAQARTRRPSREQVVPRVQPDTDHVVISYPDEVDLAAFVDYVSQSLDVKIVFGDEVRSQGIVFRPQQIEVPKSQLLDLLRSLLRMRDLALVEGDVDGWLRIVPAADMQRHVNNFRRGGAPDVTRDESNRVVTQIIPIASGRLADVVKHARAFLSSSKASIIEIPERNVILITDYESAIARAQRIIELVDVAPLSVEIARVPVAAYDVGELAGLIREIVGRQERSATGDAPSLKVIPEPSTQGILLVGSRDDVDAARRVIGEVDSTMAADRRTVGYTPQHTSADRLMRLVEHVIGPQAADPDALKLHLDAETNRLLVTCSAAVHEEIRALLRDEDLAAAEPIRPLRIYRPRNRLARDVIATLAQVLPNISDVSAVLDPPVTAPVTASAPPGPNRPAGRNRPGEPPPLPPAQAPDEEAEPGAPRIERIVGDDFVLSHDEHTNAIIALGSHEFHAKLESLLPQLDRRQPQVVIEMTLVAITFNDSLSLATELATHDTPGDLQTALFSSFGLSSIDLETGARVFNPGGGLNAVIVNPLETPLLLRAIAAHGDSRVMSTPKIVVTDGTSGTISAVEESPFTSVNASDTVATTSFAGFESAGTTMTVTPHIAEGDHLLLDYTLNFSNFTGSGTAGVPPPRTTNSFSGSVEIPDGHTVVLGGLVSENEADAVTEVPLLGRIPVVGLLFQSSERSRSKSRIFAFIRAMVLRDDAFADLRMVSRGEIEKAALKTSDFPESEYLWMR